MLSFINRGLNRGKQRRQMSRLLSTLNSGRNRAALLMTQDQNQFCVQVFQRILDAAQIVVSGDVAGNPDNKQIAQALVEYKLGRHSRIGTAQDYREWMLPNLQLLPTGEGLVRVLLPMTGIPAISFNKTGKGVIGGWISRRFL